MADPFLGQIEIFGFNFPPKRWVACNGQLLSIQQNQALFSLLGTTFGGNGVTTFALPDLRGRVPVGVGKDFQQVAWTRGQVGGTETVTLTSDQIPAHTHLVWASSAPPQHQQYRRSRRHRRPRPDQRPRRPGRPHDGEPLCP